MINPTSATTSTAAVLPTSTPAPALAKDPLSNEQTFLKLLVSQIQHQDPLNPVDSTQFLQQLTGYSQLEQLIAIKQELAPAAATAPAANTPPSTTGSTSPVGSN